MNRNNKTAHNSFIKIFSTLLIGCFTFIMIFAPLTVSAYTQSDLDAINKQLQDIKNKQKTLQGQLSSEKSLQSQYSNQINQLKLQIDILNNQIQEKQLTIQQLNMQIDLFTQNIAALTGQIATAETNIKSLETETDQRMVDIYIAEKTNSNLSVFLNSPGTDIIKYTTYQDSYQQQTNTMMANLSAERNELNAKKTDLENNKVQVVADQLQLTSEEQALTQTQSQLAQQKNDYYNKLAQSQSKAAVIAAAVGELSDQEKKAGALQDKITQDLFDQVKNITSNSFVLQGTIVAKQGYTGWVVPKSPQGAHVHFELDVNGVAVDPCSKLPTDGEPISGIGAGRICGSPANNGGKVGWPLKSTFYWTQNYWSGHHAIDIASTVTHAPVYAAISGWITKGRWGCNDPRVCYTPYVNYAIICENKNCSVGLKSLYLHLAD